MYDRAKEFLDNHIDTAVTMDAVSYTHLSAAGKV